MSAQDNLGRQWQQPELSFTVHRGLTRKPQKGRWLGMHWSADPAVARRFAGQFGTVVHGEVPISSVETDTHTLRREQVYDRDTESTRPPEKEVPVTIGKPVTVTGTTGGGIMQDPKWLEKIDQPMRSHTYNRIKTRTRKRTYKKGRELKA